MTGGHIIHGFSKLSHAEKLAWLEKQEMLSEGALSTVVQHLHHDTELQELYNGISENTLTNFFLPMGLAPNFLINGNLMTLPMVTEESSVVAAASHAAKFWAINGGFHTEVKDVLKVGQVHFTWNGEEKMLHRVFNEVSGKLRRSVAQVTAAMEQRGGGISSMELKKTGEPTDTTYQLFITLRTADAMGANFINTVLEAVGASFRAAVNNACPDHELEIIMAILSNYTPECLVKCHVVADTSAFDSLGKDMDGAEFAARFAKAVEIAQQDQYRAVTHNKGIFNGVDAVVIATGNDFRAVEAGGHAYACRDGVYRGLSSVTIEAGRFTFSLEIPLPLGTVGGLTGTHPMAAVALEILGHPDAEMLMQVVASAGLANNFSAIRSLVTTGIQHGHMKMHLGNILRQLNATKNEINMAMAHFSVRDVSHTSVKRFLEELRKKSDPG